MRCKLAVVALTLILALSGGCKQRCFLTEADMNRTTTTLLNGLETSPDLAYKPVTADVAAPPSLNHLDRKVRYLSLAEAVATSLEQGRTGQQGDNLINVYGVGSPNAGNPYRSGSDAIRVLSFTPGAEGTNIDGALSKFDAYYVSSMQWQAQDNPIANAQQAILAGAQTANVTTQATYTSSIIKPLATGGSTAITLSVPYTFTNIARGQRNPSYTPSLQFQFEQPLLQGFGVEINQLREQHPGTAGLAQIQQRSLASGTRSILLSRMSFDMSRTQFESQVNQMLLAVEQAYWNLYGAYWTLYSREQGLRFAFEAFKLNKVRFEAGRVNAADFFQSRGQYELFRAQRLQAIGDVLERERLLRGLMGLPVEDGCRLMPCDSPTLAPYLPDWCSAVAEAKGRRPELHAARLQVKAMQMRVVLAKNDLLPDLRFGTTYDINSIGNRLDGPNSADGLELNAFRGLSDNNFNNWSAALRLYVPIGYRQAHVNLRQAQLDVASAMEVLREQEQKAENFLAQQYQRLSVSYEQIRANRAQREAFGEQLKARQQEFLAGRGTLDTLLEAQRFWADALNNEFQQIVAYNNTLAQFEFAKGTIQQHDNVVIAEGPLPTCAQVRAVEHERERSAAIVLLERANPIVAGCFQSPEPIVGKAPSLPAVMAGSPPLKDVPGFDAGHTHGVVPVPGAPVESKMTEVFPDSPAPLTQVPGAKGNQGNSGPAGSTPANNSPANNAPPATDGNNMPTKIKGTPRRSEFGSGRD